MKIGLLHFPGSKTALHGLHQTFTVVKSAFVFLCWHLNRPAQASQDRLFDTHVHVKLAIMTVVNNKIQKLPIKSEVLVMNEYMTLYIILMIYSNYYVPTNLNQSSAVSLFFYIYIVSLFIMCISN